MITKRTGMTLLSVAVAGSMMLAGCSSNNSNSAASPAADQTPSADKTSPAATQKPKENVTLTAWIMPNSPKPDQDFLTAMKPYLDQNPNVKLEVTVLDWGSAWTKITTAATSGEGPDILQLGTTWVPAIAAMNGIEDVTKRVGDVGGSSGYLPASWSTTKIEGKAPNYGVPWFVDARVMFYRTDVFKKAGVDPVAAFKNWDSFKDALKKINGVDIEGKKIAAMGIPGKNDWNVAHNIFPWIWAAGGKVFNENNTKATFNNKEALDGVMYYTSLARDGLVDKASLEKNTSQVESDFSEGNNAVIVSGPYLVKNLATPSDKGGMGDNLAAKNYAVAPMPAGPAGIKTFIGGSNLTIFKGSKHKDAAWDIIKFLSTDTAQLEYSQLSGMLPAKKAVLDSLAKDDKYKAFVDATQYGTSYPSVPQWGPSETALVKYFGNIWDVVAGVSGTYSEQSIQKQLDEAAKEVNGILNQ